MLSSPQVTPTPSQVLFTTETHSNSHVLNNTPRRCLRHTPTPLIVLNILSLLEQSLQGTLGHTPRIYTLLGNWSVTLPQECCSYLPGHTPLSQMYSLSLLRWQILPTIIEHLCNRIPLFGLSRANTWILGFLLCTRVCGSCCNALRHGTRYYRYH